MRQAGRAAVDMEAFEQHRIMAVGDLLEVALGTRRARDFRDEDMVGI